MHFLCIVGIPMLVILDENNEVITSNGRGAVSKDKDGEASCGLVAVEYSLKLPRVDLCC